MKKIKLNKNFGKITPINYLYELGNEEYVINLDDEIETQALIAESINMSGEVNFILKDYFAWLKNNGFDPVKNNPTNKCVSKYYGKKPLWNTSHSKGIVVKNENDDDYYIVVEMSRNNEGFKYTQIIVTLGGCF